MDAIKSARISLEATIVPATLVIPYKIKHIVVILMNVLTKHIIAIRWLPVQTYQAVSIVHVTMGLLEMEHLAKVIPSYVIIQFTSLLFRLILTTW